MDNWCNLGVQVLCGLAGIAVGVAVLKGCFYGSGPGGAGRPNINPPPSGPRPEYPPRPKRPAPHRCHFTPVRSMFTGRCTFHCACGARCGVAGTGYWKVVPAPPAPPPARVIVEGTRP